MTSFTSSFTPLIRYDIGDYCSVLNDKNQPLDILKIKEIGGRSEDTFITQEGIHFTRFSLCLKYLPAYIIESQLILKQRSKKVLVEFLSVNENYITKDFLPFENKFQSMLGNGYNFKYVKVIKFNKSSRGKLRAVRIIK